MRTGDDLHKLIHALSKSEKRYFKIQATSNTKKDNNNYVTLFDAMDKQHPYNEAKLCKKLRKHTFATKLPKTKYLLYELILKSMQQLHQGKEDISEISSLLGSIEMLYNKSLYGQAYNLIKKAKKIATSIESNKDLLQLIDWEKRVSIYLQYNPDDQLELITQSLCISTESNRENYYKCLFEKMEILYNVTLYHYEEKEVHPEVLKIKQDRLMQNLQKPCSFKTQLYFKRTKVMIALAEKNFDQALTFLTDVYTLWKENPKKQDLFREEFVHSTTSYIIFLLNTKQKGVEYTLLLESLRVLKLPTTQKVIKTSFLVSLLDFMHCMSFEYQELAKMRFFELRELSESHIDKLDIPSKITLNYFFAIFYFLEKEYDEALVIIEKLESNRIITSFPHIHGFIKLISLVTKFEQQKFEQLEYEILKTHRYLKKRQRFGRVEELILNGTKKLLNASNQKEITGIFSNLKASLDQEMQLRDLSFLTIGGTRAMYRWINENLYKNQDRTIN